MKFSNAMKLAFNNKEDVSNFWLFVRDSYTILSNTIVRFINLLTYLLTYLHSLRDLGSVCHDLSLRAWVFRSANYQH